VTVKRDERVKQISLVQIGIGTVGGEVVAQVIANRDRWRRELGLDVQIAAVVGKEGALPGEDIAGLPDETLEAVVAGRQTGLGLTQAAGGAALVPPAEAISRLIPSGPVIVLDAAAGDETAVLHGRALATGARVVLSNKAPLALPLANPLAAELWSEAGPRGHLRYEATCGAGLPVISTLRALLDTGDEPVEIQGALSGTLGAIFADLANDVPFSAAVRSAKERGYTEPDPRDDLSGLDVARKALILARTIGREVDLTDISVESLVPANLQDVSVADFLDQVSELDAGLSERTARARANGASLKYVATVRPDGPIAVGIREVPASGVLGALQGPENVISIRTKRYDTYPLTVAGPGAGAAVTAAGMLADMLTLAR
jgi:homoserine dehydrogenase